MNVERVIKSKFNTTYPADIMVETLRIFGQGIKVVENVTMAAEDGMIPANKDVLSITVTGKGPGTPSTALTTAHLPPVDWRYVWLALSLTRAFFYQSFQVSLTCLSSEKAIAL